MNPVALNSRSIRGSVPRRRVAQACLACRGQKLRCDTGLPRCGLCVELDVDCVYPDPQNSKIDHGTRVLLERIQRLEDRLFSSPILQPTFPVTAPCQAAPNPIAPFPVSNESTWQSPAIASPVRASLLASENDNSLPTLPATHGANADHMYRASIVQDLKDRGLSEPGNPNDFSVGKPKLVDATDVFLVGTSGNHNSNLLIDTWRLFDDTSVRDFQEQSKRKHWGAGHVYEMGPPVKKYEEIIEQFFNDVPTFYSIVDREDILQYLRIAFLVEVGQQSGTRRTVGTSQYCLLLLVLCLGIFTLSEDVVLPALLLNSDPSRDRPRGPESNSAETKENSDFEIKMWQKIQLLLGYISSEDSIEAAQCFTLMRWVTI